MNMILHLSKLIALRLLISSTAFCDGVVTTADEASLRAALVGGGTVLFECDGIITLTNTLTLTNDVVLDATGREVTISGGDAVRLFDIKDSVTAKFINITLANGRAQGLDGAQSQDGGDALGGAILATSATINLINCRFWTNGAVGGSGGNGNIDWRNTNPGITNGSGGSGLGGAIYLNGGLLIASNSIFTGNFANGGYGGSNINDVVGSGGLGAGGSIYSQNAMLTFDNCLFQANSAIGGLGPYDMSTTVYRFTGDAQGGAILNDGGTVAVTNCIFEANSGTQPLLPAGIQYSYPAPVLSGGAIHNFSGDFFITKSQFATNVLISRTALPAAAKGGAIFNAEQMWISDCSFKANAAEISDFLEHLEYGADAHGGAIMNAGTLRVTTSHFFKNKVRNWDPTHYGQARGGAIYNSNELVMVGCTFQENISSSAKDAAYGGALSTINSCFLTNVTFAGNTASGNEHLGYNLNGVGGAIDHSAGSLDLVNCTLFGNSARDGIGGAIYSSTNGVASLRNTIVASSSSGSNAYGQLVDLGHNISSDSSCNFTNTGSLNNTDPKLGPLSDYGGPTPTMALLAESPAIDGGDTGNYPPEDQRSRARPFGSAPDMGAFESSPPYTIRGTILGATLEGEVSVSVSATTTSTTNGHYRLDNLSSGTHLIEPESADYLFLPPNRSITVGPDRLGIDFTAYQWNTLTAGNVTNHLLPLIFASSNNLSFRLLVSTNLVEWTPISTNAIGEGNYFEFLLPVTNAGGNAMFYRAVTP